jgi:hypothetical protein
MKNFNEIINQPTVADGTFKANNWVTNVKTDLDSGKLVVDCPDVSVAIDYAGTHHSIPVDTIVASAMYNCYPNKAELSPIEFFNLLQDGFIAKLQKVAAEKPEKPVKAPLTGHYLTAEQLQDNYFSLAANKTTIVDIYSLISGINPAKATKADLETVIGQIKALIITTEQNKTLNILIDKELSAWAVLTQLKKLGLSDCKLISESRISGSAELVAIADIVAGLPALGYEKIDAIFNAETMSILITVDKID